MTALSRARKITALRESIATNTRQHRPVAEQQKQLIGLVAQQLRFECRQDRVHS